MTPLDCARTITSFLKRACQEYDEVTTKHNGKEDKEPISVHTGFLPKCNSAAAMREQCPAVVVRPSTIHDGEEDSTVGIVVYVTVYDDDKQYAGDTLFHLLEFIRMRLLSENPIENAFVAPGMKVTVTDEQAYPMWLGFFEFDVYVQQPKKYRPELIIGGNYGKS
ncbi:hypothetical protein [Selenomonas sp. AE3005]|uniref:hypothetical protein n=1 Tax=Selenomonas sp. AE3005 TaxID=1485543 RepID=UPI0025FBC64F|nr:hypothetical protein [Selenomonas sp. AE3005]